MLFCRRRRHRVVATAFHDAHRADFHSRRGRYLFSATGSQGGLDAMINGGLGLAFFTPFDNTGYVSHSVPSRSRRSAPRHFLQPVAWPSCGTRGSGSGCQRGHHRSSPCWSIPTDHRSLSNWPVVGCGFFSPPAIGKSIQSHVFRFSEISYIPE